MQEIFLKTPSATSRIRIGEGCVKEIGALLSAQKNFLLIDANVYSLYAELVNGYFTDGQIFLLPSGEENKNFRFIELILEKMAKAGLNRLSKLFAIGGGVVGDMGGLVASLYMRGISCVQVPTSLLAQIDSSVGGKTAVDLGGVKNLIGSFYQPEEVLVDVGFLRTLPKRELKSGLGELVKYGGLNGEIFALLERDLDELLRGNLAPLTPLTVACIEHKAAVVSRDEKETGERKSLNLGHTTAHAIELSFGASHGESVLYGLALETLTTLRLGLLDGEFAQRFLSVVNKILKSEPTQKIDLSTVEAWAKKTKMDKKNTQDKVTLTLLTGEGTWTIVRLSFDEYCHEMRKSVAEL